MSRLSHFICLAKAIKLSRLSARNAFFAAAFLSTAVHTPLWAQPLPDVAKPGGAVPELEQPEPEPSFRYSVPFERREKSSNKHAGAPKLSIKAIDVVLDSDAPALAVHLEKVEEYIAALIDELGGQMTIDDLRDVTDEITDYYRRKGFVLVKAYVPEQTIAGNRVEIRVLAGRLAEVEFVGNEMFSDKTLMRPFKRNIDEPVYKEDIEVGILNLSDYPGLTGSTVFVPGSEKGTTKLMVYVEDEEFYEQYAGFDNYGSDYTGKMRAYYHGNVNNLSRAADRLDLNVMTTFSPANTQYFDVAYLRPTYFYGEKLYNKWLNPFFGKGMWWGLSLSDSAYDVGEELEDLQIQGSSNVTSLFAKKDLIRNRQTRWQLNFDVSKKSSESDQAGAQLGKDAVSVITLGSAYQRADHWRRGGVNKFSFNFHKGMAGFLGAMDEDGDGTSSRTGYSGERAGGDFSKWNFEYQRFQRLKGNQQLMFSFAMQNTGDLLTSLEQKALGGIYSMPGYPISEYLVDTYKELKLEFSSSSNVSGLKIPLNNLQLTGYWHFVSGELNDALPNEEESVSLTTIGGRAEFNPTKKLSARFDLALPIGDPEPSDDKSIQLLFGLRYEL